MVVVGKIGGKPILLFFERLFSVPVVSNAFLLDSTVESFNVGIVIRPAKTAMSYGDAFAG